MRRTIYTIKRHFTSGFVQFVYEDMFLSHLISAEEISIHMNIKALHLVFIHPLEWKERHPAQPVTWGITTGFSNNSKDNACCINTYKELLRDIQTPETEGKDYLNQVIVSPFLIT